MLAGTAKTDITPQGSVWMDGMIRSRPSAGVHDRLYARALALSEGQLQQAFVLVSVDVCILDEETARAVRVAAQRRTGIPASQIIVASTHTHSGPATYGIFTPREEAYVRDLIDKLVLLIDEAVRNLQPAEIGVTSGSETTISHYRRLIADDGHVVMNWEPFPPERIVGPLGLADDEIGVVKVVGAAGAGAPASDAPGRVLALLFNHAGHPNVLSGDNYLLSADYPGLAAQLLEGEFGGHALFFNGANGSVDIDGLRDRDWEGLERTGCALAASVAAAARAVAPSQPAALGARSITYSLPGRTLTEEEWAWAQHVLEATKGQVQAMADGVGDDYLAVLYRELHEHGPRPLPVQQACLVLGDCALLTFPGELYTEIGRHIKEASPFRWTFIIGLANGYVGYVPSRKAIEEGGYAEDTRRVDAAAEEIVVGHSLALLRSAHAARTSTQEGVGA